MLPRLKVGPHWNAIINLPRAPEAHVNCPIHDSHLRRGRTIVESFFLEPIRWIEYVQ